MGVGHEEILERPWGRLRTVIYSGGGVPLIAWPGLGGLGSRAEYFGLLAAVSPYHVIAIDPPGIGPVSTGRPDTTTSRRWVQELAGMNPKGFMLLGHSWGAYLMLWMASRIEPAPAGVVLLDGGYFPWWTVPTIDHEAVIQFTRGLFCEDRVTEVTTALTSTLTQLATAGYSVTAAVEHLVRAQWMKNGDDGYTPALSWTTYDAAVRALVQIPETDLGPAPCPVLLITPVDSWTPPITSEEQALGFPAEGAYRRQRTDALHRFRTRLPGTTVCQVPNMGHDVLLDQPVATARTIGHWLAKIGLTP